MTGITGTLARSYSYDAAGNTLSDSQDTDTYDDAGRLKALANTSGTTTFTYNALGQMIEASSSGPEIYVYDQAEHLLGEYDGAGNLIQETVWLGDIPVATLRPNGSSVAIYYVVTDQLNTPREVIRPSDNTVLWTWFTAPFGVETPNTNPQGAGTFIYDLRFPGQVAGTWGGTFQNDHRDYDPAVGKYMESDPIGLLGLYRINREAAKRQWMLVIGSNSGSPAFSELPQTDLYTYGIDDPIGVIDPRGKFGLIGWAAIGITAAAAGAVIYAIYKCAEACASSASCPYAASSGDPVTEGNRSSWVFECKLRCVKSFGEAAKVGPW